MPPAREALTAAGCPGSGCTIPDGTSPDATFPGATTPGAPGADHPALTEAGFAARMARLGPYAPQPLLAAGVSGGADSLALALLADRWARARGGALRALIVDHGLRPGSAAEARLTAAWLAGHGIPARILTLGDLRPGAGLAARARAARLAALAAACAEAGVTDLLLGHHAGDQAETWLMRAQARSGPDGRAGMAALRHTAGLRLLRPLLDVPPEALRSWLRARGQNWVEDPSNRDPARLRTRLRPPARAWRPALLAAAGQAADGRRRREAAAAAWLAAHATIRPEGVAVIPRAPLPAGALGALIRLVAGADYPAAPGAVAALAAAPRPATLGGVRLLDAGAWGPGLLMVREPAALAPPVAALPGARWDGRFRLLEAVPPGLLIGALGAAVPRSRLLPAAVARVLPALWRPGTAGTRDILVAVPTVMYRDAMSCRRLPGHPTATLRDRRPAVRFLFDPPCAAACAPFEPAWPSGGPDHG